jgi:hypothetical protein
VKTGLRTLASPKGAVGSTPTGGRIQLPTTESEVLRGILGYLSAMRIIAWRQNTGAVKTPGTTGRDRFVRYGFPGLPDVIGVLPGGRALFIEVKKPGGRVRPEQRAFLDAATRAGAVAFVAYSMDDVDARLKKEGVL